MTYALRVPAASDTWPTPTSQQPGSRLSIFLSHSMSDGRNVSVVQRQIEALGVDVYLAEHDPQPGTSIAARVECALRESDAAVFLITTNSIDSA